MPETGDQRQPEIPDRLYYRIGEVSRLLGVKPYVLRYWETEFPALAPKKSSTGQRLYRRRDVELLLEIKRLLYEKRYTLEGARRHLEGAGRAGRALRGRSSRQAGLFHTPPADLEQIRKDLAEILEMLK
jgi:DNA-binding transcriptional MerR regulator